MKPPVSPDHGPRLVTPYRDDDPVLSENRALKSELARLEEHVTRLTKRPGKFTGIYVSGGGAVVSALASGACYDVHLIGLTVACGLVAGGFAIATLFFTMIFDPDDEPRTTMRENTKAAGPRSR